MLGRDGQRQDPGLPVALVVQPAGAKERVPRPDIKRNASSSGAGTQQRARHADHGKTLGCQLGGLPVILLTAFKSVIKSCTCTSIYSAQLPLCAHVGGKRVSFSKAHRILVGKKEDREKGKKK